MEMVAFFAGTALLLAGLGIYGTISYLANEQRREIAIRLALGAQRRDVLRMVLRRGLGLAAIGVLVGVVGAVVVAHLMGALLYGVSPNDVGTFVGVTVGVDGGGAGRELCAGGAGDEVGSDYDVARGVR